MFIDTVPPEAADGDVADLYDSVSASWGFLPNWARVFAMRPEAYAAWNGLAAAVADRMDRRRYELATIAAARQVGSTYCSMAHTRVLVDRFHEAAEVHQIVTDPSAAAALDDTDRAVMTFAAHVARDATSISAEDVAALRSHGLDDGEVLDVALAAAARCFFAKVLDAMGAAPDAQLAAIIGPDLTAASTTTGGRPVEHAAP